jgi:hypothetical protein
MFVPGFGITVSEFVCDTIFLLTSDSDSDSGDIRIFLQGRTIYSCFHADLVIASYSL